jgi:hypothetical protein
MNFRLLLAFERCHCSHKQLTRHVVCACVFLRSVRSTWRRVPEDLNLQHRCENLKSRKHKHCFVFLPCGVTREICEAVRSGMNLCDCVEQSHPWGLPTVLQLVKKNPLFWGAWRIVTTFTTARQINLLHALQSSFLKFYCITILPSVTRPSE